MLRNLLLATLIIAAVAGCRLKGDPEIDPVKLSCTAVGSVCSDHAECCSFGCVHGICGANTTEGGVCRTSDDCSYTMTCVQGFCRTGFTCQPTFGDSCTFNNDCCSGNCLGENTSVYPATPGTCGTETAPVAADGSMTVPYYHLTTLSVTVTDPDPEDTKVYAWSLVAGPGGHTLGAWTSTAAQPTFFPNVPGTYTFQVRVTDGPATQRNRASDTATITVQAVNQPPVVDADPTPIATTLRNVPVMLTGNVSDPNLAATPVSCTWYATPPAGAEAAIAGGTWPSCPPSPSVAFTPPIAGPQGDWTFRLEASDGEFVTSDVRTIQVVNAPPVAEACAGTCAAPPGGGLPNVRVGNLGPPGEAAPAIPLTGAATDQNFDVPTPGFTWEWIVDSVPAGSSVPIGTVASGSGAQIAASFIPDPNVTGTYVLRLHVDDDHGGSADDTVDVVVYPWLRPLHAVDAGTGLPRGTVGDVAYVHGTDRLVLAGYDGPSLTNRLWVIDPESPHTTVSPSVALGGTPLCLGVSADGGEAIVGESGPRWQRVSLGGTPSASAQDFFGPGWSGVPNDIVDFGSREYAVSSTGIVHELGSTAGSTSTAVICDNCASVTGTRVVGGMIGVDEFLWILNEATGELRRYFVKPNRRLDLSPSTVVSGLSSSSDLWLSAIHGTNQREVALGGGSVIDAAALTGVASLPFASRHMDTTVVATVPQGIVVNAIGDDVRTLDASYAATGALPVPRVGHAGTGYPALARFAFVRTDGTAHYVLLRATVDFAERWYLLKY